MITIIAKTQCTSAWVSVELRNLMSRRTGQHDHAEHVLEVKELGEERRMGIVVRPRPLFAEAALRTPRQDVAYEVARKRDENHHIQRREDHIKPHVQLRQSHRLTPPTPL
jgi:hypothetical protein